MDLRWIQPKNTIKYPLFFCSLQTSTLSLQFSIFLGVTSPDLTTLTRSHGELQVRAGDEAN